MSRRVLAVALGLATLGCLFGAAAGVSLDLRGVPFLLLLLTVAVTVDTAVAVAWNRWPHSLRAAGRLAGILLISIMGMLVALDVLNRQEGFYSSFSDIFGGEPQRALVVKSPRAVERPRLDILTPNWRLHGLTAAKLGRGEILDVRYWGARSRIVRRGYIYLPAAYFSDLENLRFPVVELLHGQPGGPPNVVRQMTAPALLDEEIRARKLPPVIVVIPAENTHGLFTECVDAVHGQLNETFLALDVPDDTISTFRAARGRSWGLVGYSTGGFCAVNLALHHPGRYSVAASLSGYFVPATDPNTASLYMHSKAALNRNSPVWWVTHHAPVAPGLYLFASRDDHAALTALENFRMVLRAHAPLLPSVSDVLPQGGHNWNVWRSGLRYALEWMAGFLPMPLNQT